MKAASALALLAFGAFGAFGAWRIFAVGLADTWAEEAPDQALAWNARNVEALTSAALASLPDDPARAEALARRAIAQSSVEGRAYGALARALDAQARDAQAVFAVAVRLAPDDVDTRLAYARVARRDGRVATLVDQLVALSWLAERGGHVALADLVRVARTAEGFDAVLARLANAPRTRADVFALVCTQARDAALPDRFYAALVARGGASAEERRAYLERLVRDGRWFDAWAARRDALPPDARASIENLVDGGFEAPFGEQPFDWQTGGVKGAAIERAAARGGHALQVDFFGERVPFAHVRQYLLLAPGRYRLTGLASVALDSPRGLRWSVACAGKPGAPLAVAGPFVGRRDWSAFEAELEVPASGCDAQLLRLESAARAAVEQQIAGRVQFDDLALARLRNP